MAEDKDKPYALTYHALAIEELKALDPSRQDEVFTALQSRLATNPEHYGKPLRYSLKGCRSLRVGDYRVVFKVEKRTLRILAVKHRSKGYGGIERRI